MRALCGLLLLGMLACGGDAGPAKINVDGSWSGNFTFSSGATGTLSMVLAEANGQVTGNGTTVGPGGSIAETITGTYSQPSVSLTFHSEGYADSNLSAIVSESQMTGQLLGSGFNGVAITLTRR